VRVSGDDDEIVNERGRCDQTVLYRHRFTGLAQFSQKRSSRPVRASHGTQTPGMPHQTKFEPTTSLPRR
jgi:hypothetical protein